MADLMIGKSKIDISQRGCLYCGTRFSYHWTVVRTFKVTIEVGKWGPVHDLPKGRNLTRELTLSACGHCCGMKEPAFPQPSRKAKRKCN